MTETDGFGIDGFDRTVERLKRELAAREAELAEIHVTGGCSYIRLNEALQRAEAAEAELATLQSLHDAGAEPYDKEIDRLRDSRDEWKRKAEEAERDAGRYRWLIKQVSHDEFIPIAQVVWKQFSNPHGEWVNLINGADLDAHIDSHLPAIAAKGEA